MISDAAIQYVCNAVVVLALIFAGARVTEMCLKRFPPIDKRDL